jgi:hypothetical protein
MSLYWAYDSARSRDAGAIEPQQLSSGFGQRRDGLTGFDLQRAYSSSGRAVEPSDCGPVRLVARYGYAVRAPGRVVASREDQPLRWREHSATSAAFGPVRVSGDAWHGTESEFVASWIAGSEYLKISTGLLVFFPHRHVLVQGPLPNPGLSSDDPDWSPPPLEVMTGVEYYTPRRSRLINGAPYGMAAMNVIARIPPGESKVEFDRGQVLGWFFLGLAPADQELDPLPGLS